MKIRTTLILLVVVAAVALAACGGAAALGRSGPAGESPSGWRSSCPAPSTMWRSANRCTRR